MLQISKRQKRVVKEVKKGQISGQKGAKKEPEMRKKAKMRNPRSAQISKTLRSVIIYLM